MVGIVAELWNISSISRELGKPLQFTVGQDLLDNINKDFDLVLAHYDENDHCRVYVYEGAAAYMDDYDHFIVDKVRLTEIAQELDMQN